MAGNGAGNRHALALAAGKLVRIAGGKISAEPHLLQGFQRPLALGGLIETGNEA